MPLPILEKVVGGGHNCEHGNDRTQQLKRQGQAQRQESSQVAARERFESLASDHISIVSTPPIEIGLMSPLPRVASDCLEKIRFRPAAGEIRENFGANVS